MSWRRSGYYRAAERRRELGLPFGRGSEEWIKHLQCVTAGCRDVVLCCFLLPPRLVAERRSSRSSVLISPAGACMPWDSLESLLKWAASVSGWASGQHTMSRPRGWQLAPANNATRDSIRAGRGRRGFPAAHGGPSEAVVSGEVGSSRPPIMRPGTAPGRAGSAEDVGCICRSRAVPE